MTADRHSSSKYQVGAAAGVGRHTGPPAYFRPGPAELDVLAAIITWFAAAAMLALPIVWLVDERRKRAFLRGAARRRGTYDDPGHGRRIRGFSIDQPVATPSPGRTRPSSSDPSAEEIAQWCAGLIRRRRRSSASERPDPATREPMVAGNTPRTI